MEQPIPASQTKNLSNLSHPLTPPNQHIVLSLKQISSSSDGSSTGTTGTTLWLSSQVLALYLSSILSTSTNTPAGDNGMNGAKGKKTILELGGGIGYTPLNLLTRGYRVITTDIQPVLSDVLEPNVNNGLRVLRNHGIQLGDDDIMVKELDWLKVSSIYDQINRNNDGIDHLNSNLGSNADLDLGELDWLLDFRPKGLDMIIMSDTFYHPELIEPLWKTLLYISIISSSSPYTSSSSAGTSPDQSSEKPSSSSQRKPPTIYIGLERRDPTLIDQALNIGKNYKFDLKKIGKGRLNKEIQSSWSNWKGHDWDGVEIWKCRWRG